jgi:hypothetical protein
MPRNIIAAIVGIAVAVITVILMEWLSHSIFPPPVDVDFNDPEVINNLVMSAPAGALALVLAGYLMGTFDGVFVACLIGRSNPSYYAMLIAVLMLAGTISTLLTMKHPTWFSVSAITGIILAAWLAAKVAPKIKLPGVPKE